MKPCVEKWMSKAHASWISTSWWLPCVKWVKQSARSSDFWTRSLLSTRCRMLGARWVLLNVNSSSFWSSWISSSVRDDHAFPSAVFSQNRRATGRFKSYWVKIARNTWCPCSWCRHDGCSYILYRARKSRFSRRGIACPHFRRFRHRRDGVCAAAEKFVVHDIPKTLCSDSCTSVLARCTVPLAPQRSLPLQAREAVRSPVTGENEIKAELNALWTALKKLAASLMWRTANAAATSAAITAACTERLPERTTEQIEVIPLLQAPASQVTGSLIRLDESDAVVYPQVCQEQYAAGETNRNRVDAPTVQEPLLGQGIPELQVVEQKQERTVEAIKVNPLERVQRRAVEQSVSLFERLEEFDKRLEMSLARRAENDEMIKEIGILLEEEKTCNAETGFSRFWAGGMGSGGYWISPIWVGSRGRVRIAPPRFRCTHMFDVSSNPSDGSCTFQMVGWSDVYVIATSVNLNNGELVEWSSIGTVTCQQCDEWGAFIDLQLWSIAWNDHLSVSISVLRISSSFVHCCFFCAPWIFICLS